jgi:hypothetical protein
LAAGNADSFSNLPGDTEPYFILPTAFNNTNPGFSADVKPIFTEVNIYSYILNSIPADFGIGVYYEGGAIIVRDKLIVTATTEEWEMIAASSNTSASGAAAIMFVARVV